MSGCTTSINAIATGWIVCGSSWTGANGFAVFCIVCERYFRCRRGINLFRHLCMFRFSTNVVLAYDAEGSEAENGSSVTLVTLVKLGRRLS